MLIRIIRIGWYLSGYKKRIRFCFLNRCIDTVRHVIGNRRFMKELKKFDKESQ